MKISARTPSCIPIWFRFCVCLLTGTGIVLRIYGIDFGLPDLLHPDESFEINRALRLATGAFDFRRAGKGGFYFIIFGEMGLSFVLLYIVGIVSRPLDFAYFFISHEPAFYLMARLTSCLIGILSIYAIYRAGEKTGGKWTGLCAAILLALSGLSIKNSHYATVDNLLVFLLIITWFRIFSALETRKPKDLYLAALFAGLSIITKLSGVVILIPLAGLCICHLIKRAVTVAICFRQIAIAAIICVVVIFGGEPGYIHTLQNFSGKIRELFATSSIAEGLFRYSNINLFYYYFNVLIGDTGPILLAVFFISSFYFIRQRSVPEILLLSFGLPYFLLVSSTSSTLYFSRYMMPLMPVMILIISRGFSYLLEYTRSGHSGGYFQGTGYGQAVIMIFFVFCIPGLVNSARTGLEFGVPQPRVQAREWVLAHVPSGSSILMEGHPEHRSQFLVQVLNSRKNVDRIIDGIGERDSGKKRYWEMQRDWMNTLDVPRYDLEFMRYDSLWPDYGDVRKRGTDYLIFDLGHIEKDIQRQSSAAVNSRKIFYNCLIADTEFVKVATFGDSIVIYKNRNMQPEP